MHAIEIKNVSKKFKEKKKWFYALKDVNFDVKKGEIFGLLGPNGAGKTTLLNIIVGILHSDEGGVRVLGKDVSKESSVLERVNYVSGETRFHWLLKVKDVLNYYAKAYGLPKKIRKRRIAKLLKFFGLREIVHRTFESLSTGEKRRLVFAKALLNKPELILFDEPTLGLDPDMAIKVRREIKRLNREFGTTILLTSHYMHEVEQLSDRIAFINKGEIVDIGSVESVKLKKFATYDVIIKIAKVYNKRFLTQAGFKVKGRKLYKSLVHDESLSKILVKLAEKKYQIIDLEVRKPTLEDYFIKILKVKK